jgi:hypothetical protein
VQGVVDSSRTLGDVVVVAATWDHLDVVHQVSQRIGAPQAILPGNSGAVAGTDDYIAFVDTLVQRLADAAAEIDGVKP